MGYLINLIITIILFTIFLFFIQQTFLKIKKTSKLLNAAMLDIRNTVKFIAFYNEEINKIDGKLKRIQKLNDITINNIDDKINCNKTNVKLYNDYSNGIKGKNKLKKIESELTKEDEEMLGNIANCISEDTLKL